MAGLSNRSRPVQGVGQYILPLGFKLAPDINTKHKNIVVPIIKSDFKLRPKVSEVIRTPLSPIQRKAFELHTKLSNVTRENLTPTILSAFTLSCKIEKAPVTTIAAQPKTAYASGVYPRSGLDVSVFAGNIYAIGESEDIVLKGGSSVKNIINDVGKSSITNKANSKLELEFFTTDPVKIRGFEFRAQLDSPLSSYAPASIGIYNIEGGANVNVMSISGLSINEPLKSYFKSLPELRHFKVIFFGRTSQVSLQYFKLF